MGDPTGLSSVLAGKLLDTAIGYVKTANGYNARQKDLEDLVHTTGTFLQACPSGIAQPIVQRVFQDVQPLHKGAQVLVRKRQNWEDKTTTFDRHLRLHTRWKLSKDALDHTQKIRTTEADRLPRAILVSVLDLQKELKSLRKDVRDIKSSLGHAGDCKQEPISMEKETPKQEKRKQKRRKQKTHQQEKDGEAAGKGMDIARADCITNSALEQEKDGETAGKGMDSARADCITNFALGVRSIQERLIEAIKEGGHEAFFDVIDGAMRQVVNLHLESIRSAQITQLCPSSTVTSESWDSTITVKSFRQVRDGRDLKNAVLRGSSGGTEHMETEEIELAEDVGIEEEGHRSEMVVQFIEKLHGPTATRYISREIPYGEIVNFTFEALKIATDDFANVIGAGSYGPVYKGCLPDGSKIAVKRNRRGSAQDEQEFWREVQYCSFAHPAIVKMLGWCAPAPAPAKLRRQRFFLFKKEKEELLSDGRRERCIVTEYLEGRSLHHQLFGDDVQGLEWPVRLKICIGASAGISFLHKQGVVHRDIKPGNILLDKNFSPKITDFGISLSLPEGTSGTTSDIRSPGVTEMLDRIGVESFKPSALCPDMDGVTTNVKGTVGYVDPEYMISGRVGPKSDVYSFGITLLNVVSGSRALDLDRAFRSVREDGDFETLLERARRFLRENKFRELIDPKMERTIKDVTDVKEVVRIALLCIEPKGEDRPTIDEVHSMLLKVGSEHG